MDYGHCAMLFLQIHLVNLANYLNCLLQSNFLYVHGSFFSYLSPGKSEKGVGEGQLVCGKSCMFEQVMSSNCTFEFTLELIVCASRVFPLINYQAHRLSDHLECHTILLMKIVPSVKYSNICSPLQL